jgi:transcriptional regulator with XRE-family HTH domain
METPRVSPYLAAELRAEMGRKNMSQRQVALRLGRPPLWLSRRVGGTATVDLTLEEVSEIADALGANVEGIVVAALRACRDSNPKPSVLESGALRARLTAVTSTAELQRRLRLVAVNHKVTENRVPAGWPIPEPSTPLPTPESGYRGRHLKAVS